MDGESSGKPYEQMDDLGVPLFLETPISEKDNILQPHDFNDFKVMTFVKSCENMVTCVYFCTIIFTLVYIFYVHFSYCNLEVLRNSSIMKWPAM